MSTPTKRILAVTTNESPVYLGKKSGMYMSELTHFVEEVMSAGYTVDLATCKGGPVPLDITGSNGSALTDPATSSFLKDERLKGFLKNSLCIKDLNADNYDALYVPGGFGVLEDVGKNQDFQNLVTQFYTAGKVLSSVCHGGSAFIHSKDKDGNSIIKGKKVTATSNIDQIAMGINNIVPFRVQDELKKAGGIYVRNIISMYSAVTVDGKLVMGQNPFATHGVGNKVVEVLTGKPHKSSAKNFYRLKLIRNMFLNMINCAGPGAEIN